MVYLHALLLKGVNLCTTLHLLGHIYDPSHRKETARTHKRMHEFVLELDHIFGLLSL